jgi:hypothetical protein
MGSACMMWKWFIAKHASCMYRVGELMVRQKEWQMIGCCKCGEYEDALHVKMPLSGGILHVGK